MGYYDGLNISLGFFVQVYCENRGDFVGVKKRICLIGWCVNSSNLGMFLLSPYYRFSLCKGMQYHKCPSRRLQASLQSDSLISCSCATRVAKETLHLILRICKNCPEPCWGEKFKYPSLLHAHMENNDFVAMLLCLGRWYLIICMSLIF